MFDLSNVQVQENSPLESGEYPVIIEKMELKDSKSGGKYLSVMYRIYTGKGTKRCIFENINVQNSSLKAQEIGLQTLKKLCLACEIPSEEMKNFSPSKLIDKTLIVKVLTKSDDGGFTFVSKVVNYKSHSEMKKEIHVGGHDFKNSSDEIPF